MLPTQIATPSTASAMVSSIAFVLPEPLLRGALSVVEPLVIGLGLWTLMFLTYKALSISRVIQRKVSFLREIRADELMSKFDAIVADFTEAKLLEAHWKEFDSSLVKKRDQVLTTVDAASFFNEYTLVDGPLSMEFYRHVPGILTALGIIGTFVGLIVGLEHFDHSSSAALQDSITNLFLGVRGAFQVSFLAISLSVLVTSVERGVTTHLYTLVQRLDEGLNRLFNRSLSEDYLHDMVQQMDQQTQSLKSFSQDLAEAIRQAMEELVDRQSQSIAQANQMVATQVSQAMEASVAPAVNRLVSTVEDMQQRQADSSHQALNDLVGQFTSTLSQTTGRQIDGLMAGMEATTGILGSLQGEMSAFVGSVQQQMTTQRTQLEELLGRTMASSADNQRKLQDELGQFLSQTAVQLEKLQRQMTEEAGSSVTRLGNELSAMVARSAEQQQEAMNALSGTIAEHQARMERGLKDVIERMQASSGEAARTLVDGAQEAVRQVQQSSDEAMRQSSSLIGAAISDLVAQTKEVASGSNRLNQELGERFEKLGGLLEGLASTTTSATTQLNDQLGRSTERLASLSASIEGLLGAFETTIGKTRQLVGEMGEGISSVQEGAKAVADAAKSYAATHEATQRVLGSVTMQSNLAEERLAEFAQVVQQLRQHNDALKATLERHSTDLADVKGDTASFFAEVRKEVREYAEAVQTATEQYHDLVSSKMAKFLGQLDTEMATAVKRLHTSVADLEETLGVLIEAPATAAGRGVKK